MEKGLNQKKKYKAGCPTVHRESGVLGILVIGTGCHFYTMPDVFSEKIGFSKKNIELLWKILNEIKFCFKKRRRILRHLHTLSLLCQRIFRTLSKNYEILFFAIHFFLYKQLGSGLSPQNCLYFHGFLGSILHNGCSEV